jgi:hypothetical protein
LFLNFFLITLQVAPNSETEIRRRCPQQRGGPRRRRAHVGAVRGRRLRPDAGTHRVHLLPGGVQSRHLSGFRVQTLTAAETSEGAEARTAEHNGRLFHASPSRLEPRHGNGVDAHLPAPPLSDTRHGVRDPSKDEVRALHDPHLFLCSAMRATASLGAQYFSEDVPGVDAKE